MKYTMKNYSTKYNLTFIHIPKNAGTSINEILEIPPEHRGHNYPKELERRKCISFCIIRNPWDRMVSLYRFRKKKGHDKIIFKEKDYSFKEWLFNQNVSQIAGKMEWENQVNIICDKNSKLLVDYVLKYENLVEEWKNFGDLLGLSFSKIPHFNSSGEKKDYKEYYDSETRSFISKKFIKDIQMLDYEF